MAKTYDFKDAKKLIKEYKELLNNLNLSNKYVNKFKNEVKNEINFKMSSNYFNRNLSQELKELMPRDRKNEEIYGILKAAYCYSRSNEISNYCISLYNENNDIIKTHVKTLSRGNNAIKWFFAGRRKKEEAEKAFNELKEEENNSFYRNSINLLQELKGLYNVEANLVYTDVLSNEEKYKDIIFKIDPTILERGSKVYEIEKLFSEHTRTKEDFAKMDDNFNNCKLEIKNAVDDLMKVELLKILKDIPVEELNRKKNGIRVKTLMESGFASIADIYTSSVNQLSAIQGISNEAASNIKKIADSFAKEAYKNTRINLNSDDKNLLASKVVILLYKYKNKRKLILEKDNLLNLFNNEIEEKLNSMREIANGVKYYFSDINIKENYINAYKWLNDTVFGELYGVKANNILKEYNLKNEPSETAAWEDFTVNSIEYYNLLEEICQGILGNDDTYYGLPEDLAREIQEQSFLSQGLLCTLRQYQEWGVKYILHQEKVLLGDEMGLGKTIQAIAAMVSLRNTGATHFLVVCPASVVTNWCREITKHSNLTATKIHGSKRNSELKSWLKNGGVAVTTFETTQHIKFEDTYTFSMMIVDEAHYIKNPETIRSINTERISKHAQRILFMTGTALENNVDEMINLITILKPTIAKEIKNIAFMSSAPQFREKIAPVYYRRKREDVLKELPELIETKEWCTMNKKEEEVYEESILNGTYPQARRLSWNVDDLKYSSKAERLKELVEEAESEGRKVIVFSFFLETIQKIANFLGDRCSMPITGAIDSERRQEIIDKFGTAPAGSVLLAQIIAGGTGLNIQSASVVIICEPQFKPSIENQAISRAYRMGQARNVLVYRLLCDNTIDERITELLEEKQKIFDTFADESVVAEKSLEIDNRAFGDIIKEETERINKKRGQ